MTTTTIATYVGNGSQTDFAFSFDYLRKEFVVVLVDGVTTAYTFHTTQTVRVTPAPAAGKVVIVRRITDRDRLVQFVDGSILIANDLNVAALQSLHIASEALDQASGGLLIDETGAYSAGFRKLAYLGDPTNARDAVNKQWAETAMSSQLALATAEKAAAVVAKDAAVVAKDAAVVSQGAAAGSAAAALADRNLAQTAKTGADTAKTGADTAKAGADTAKTGADTAKAAAETARDVTLGYRDTTQTLRDETVAASLLALADVNADAENKIINGDMGVWQRGTSFSTSVYGADRWLNNCLGGTVTTSRQSFTPGDTLGTIQPTFFLRQAVSGQTLTTHNGLVGQRLESVRSYAGQTITVLGWARRSSGTGNMAVEVSQYFGTGGAPSAEVLVTPVTVTLDTVWAPFAVTFTLPSITGKTIGTAGNDSMPLRLWTSAGSSFNARTNSLGLQTIGVDLWGIHIRQGTWTAAATNLYRTRPPGAELALCQRFYQTAVLGGTNGAIHAAGQVFSATAYLPVLMRIAPVVTVLSDAVLSFPAGAPAFIDNGAQGRSAVSGYKISTGANTNARWTNVLGLDAEI